MGLGLHGGFVDCWASWPGQHCADWSRLFGFGNWGGRGRGLAPIVMASKATRGHADSSRWPPEVGVERDTEQGIEGDSEAFASGSGFGIESRWKS